MLKAEVPERLRGGVVAPGRSPGARRYSVYSAADVATVSYHETAEDAHAAAAAFAEEHRPRLRGKNVLVIDREHNAVLARLR